MATFTKRGKSYLIRASSGYTVDGKQVRPSMTWRPDPGMTERQIEKELQRQKNIQTPFTNTTALAGETEKTA